MAQKKWVLYSAMIFYIKKTSRRNTDNNEGNITKFPVHSFFFFNTLQSFYKTQTHILADFAIILKSIFTTQQTIA